MGVAIILSDHGACVGCRGALECLDTSSTHPCQAVGMNTKIGMVGHPYENPCDKVDDQIIANITHLYHFR